ncbi:MAG: protein-disulfide isomerase [Candidatus Midichloriaceae bacterium]|jgi:protein-disulfide isomerase
MNAKKISVLLIFLIVIYGGYFYYKKFISTSSSVSHTVALKKSDVIEIIRNELKENPTIVVDAFKAHLDNQQKKEEERITGAIEDNKNDPKYGKSDAKNTVIAFYDYNCSYCKNMSSVIDKLITDRNDTFVVFKELPILGKASAEASKAALAVNIIAPDKFLAFHNKLMDSQKSGKSIENVIKDSAESLQINTDNLFKMMNTAEVQSILENNRRLAMNLGIRGTPALVINGQLYPGAMNFDQITKILDEDDTSSVDTSPVDASSVVDTSNTNK